MNDKHYRILLVDDDSQLLKMGEKIIQRLGYNVIAHNKSTDALELFRDLPNQFDLVITDYRMPDMNGAELSKEILKITPDIPIIMCSGFSSDFSEEDAYFLGIKWFIRKPLMKKDFANLIEEALNLN
jgi:DNA-binding NtrC family response regulator